VCLCMYVRVYVSMCVFLYVYVYMYVCTCVCMCMYVCTYIYVVRSAFVTKYSKLQLCGLAARMETNIHTIFLRGHIMEYKKRGRKLWDGNTIKRQDVRRRDEWSWFRFMAKGSVRC
jgi:hypothetical protein